MVETAKLEAMFKQFEDIDQTLDYETASKEIQAMDPNTQIGVLQGRRNEYKKQLAAVELFNAHFADIKDVLAKGKLEHSHTLLFVDLYTFISKVGAVENLKKLIGEVTEKINSVLSQDERDKFHAVELAKNPEQLALKYIQLERRLANLEKNGSQGSGTADDAEAKKTAKDKAEDDKKSKDKKEEADEKDPLDPKTLKRQSNRVKHWINPLHGLFLADIFRKGSFEYRMGEMLDKMDVKLAKFKEFDKDLREAIVILLEAGNQLGFWGSPKEEMLTDLDITVIKDKASKFLNEEIPTLGMKALHINRPHAVWFYVHSEKLMESRMVEDGTEPKEASPANPDPNDKVADPTKDPKDPIVPVPPVIKAGDPKLEATNAAIEKNKARLKTLLALVSTEPRAPRGSDHADKLAIVFANLADLSKPLPNIDMSIKIWLRTLIAESENTDVGNKSAEAIKILDSIKG